MKMLPSDLCLPIARRTKKQHTMANIALDLSGDQRFRKFIICLSNCVFVRVDAAALPRAPLGDLRKANPFAANTLPFSPEAHTLLANCASLLQVGEAQRSSCYPFLNQRVRVVRR